MTVPTVRPGWQRAVIIGVVAVIVVAAGGFWWWAAHRKGVTFSAVFTESIAVYPGSDVRVLGVHVGAVDSVTPHGTEVVVGMHLDPGVNVTAGTWAVIVSPNLVGERYVQLTGAYRSGPKLRSGARIEAARTRTPVELDELYRNLTEFTQALGPQGANKNGALSRLLETSAKNLAGNGPALNATLRRLSATGSTLAGSKDDIAGSLDHLSQFSTMLAQNNDGVRTVNQQLAAVSQTLADDRVSFGQALSQLSKALGLVQTFVHDNRHALTSNIAKLNTVAATLARERSSLLKAVSSAPLLIQNFINAYDPKQNVLRGRADLNEIGVWDPSAAGANSSGPPTLLPTTGGGR